MLFRGKNWDLCYRVELQITMLEHHALSRFMEHVDFHGQMITVIVMRNMKVQTDHKTCGLSER